MNRNCIPHPLNAAEATATGTESNITGRIVQKRKRSQWYVLSLQQLRPPHASKLTTAVSDGVVVYVPRSKRHNHSTNNIEDDEFVDVMYFLDSIVQVHGYMVDRLPVPATVVPSSLPNESHIHCTNPTDPPDPLKSNKNHKKNIGGDDIDDHAATAGSDHLQPPTPTNHPGFFFVTNMTLIQCAPNIRAISVLLRQYKHHHHLSLLRRSAAMTFDATTTTTGAITDATAPLPTTAISVFIPVSFHPERHHQSDLDETITATKTTSTIELVTSVKHFKYMYRVILANLKHHYKYVPNTDDQNSTECETSTTATDDKKTLLFETVTKLQQFILRGLQNQLVFVDDDRTDEGTMTMTGITQCRRSKIHHRQRIPRISKTDLLLLENMEQQLRRHSDPSLPLLQIPTYVSMFQTEQCDPQQQPQQRDPSSTFTSTKNGTNATGTEKRDSQCSALYGIDFAPIIDLLFYHPIINVDDIDDLHHDNDDDDDCDNNDDDEYACECIVHKCDNNEPSTNNSAAPQQQSTVINEFTLSSRDQKSSRGSLSRYDYYIQKKIPQIQYMIQRVLTILDHVDAIASVKKPFSILDVGGGRGDLSILLAYTLVVLRLRSTTTTTSDFAKNGMRKIPNHVHITVIDRNQQSLRIGEQYAEFIFHTLLELDYRTFITFQCCDFIKEYINAPSSPIVRTDPNPVDDASHHQQHSSDAKPTSFDLIVALHACGDLTDAALYYATHVCCNRHTTNQRPSFIICPCCYNKSCSYHNTQTLNEPNFTPPYFQFVHPPHIQESACTNDVASDAFTNGESECVTRKRTKRTCNATTTNEIYPPWIKPIQKLAEVSQQFSVCRRAAIIINSLRVHYSTLLFLSSSVSHAPSKNISNSDANQMIDESMTVQLEEFSSSYSRRNIVIVGSYS